MEYKEIRELTALMKELGLTTLEYEGVGLKIKLGMTTGVPYAAPAANVYHAPEPADQPREEPAQKGGITVKSPVVGIFHSAESPNKEPYVTVGDTVSPGDVLCLIDAMKIMNEIVADCSGVIEEICVTNNQIVEFNQPLFRITPI